MLQDVIFCPECGEELVGHPDFCPNCGFQLNKVTNEQSSNNDFKYNHSIHRSDWTKKRKHISLKLISALIFIVLVIGCIFNLIKGTEYQSLNNSIKNKIVFTFTVKDGGQNPADLLYNISMKIKNNSSKTIKFNLNDFKMIGEEETLKSTKNGVIIIRPNKKVSIKNIFKKVGDQTVLGDSFFAYKNYKNALAFGDFFDTKNRVVTSNNLESSKKEINSITNYNKKYMISEKKLKRKISANKEKENK